MPRTPRPRTAIDEQDPFGDLFNAVQEIQEQAKSTLTRTKQLYRLVKTAQRNLKLKKREIVRTQRLIAGLTNLKKVSGF